MSGQRLIDADALIKDIEFNKADFKTRYPKMRFTVNDAIECIKTAPTVATIKYGQWVNVYMSGPSSFVGTCSNCKTSNDIPPPQQAHFCPNCGAQMKYLK